MVTRAWGYSGQVGEWFGKVDIPLARRVPPAAAIQWMLDQVVPMLTEMHRPRRMFVSWAEYDEQGQEAGFHELEQVECQTWEGVKAELPMLAVANDMFAVSALFLLMDTAVVEDGGIFWADSSAELQVSVPPPELTPEVASVSYRTYIDVWLSVTFGEDKAERANYEPAELNGPRIEGLLRAYSALLGESYRVGESDFYHASISETGFRRGGAPPLSST
jgi:hypothetical protein